MVVMAHGVSVSVLEGGVNNNNNIIINNNNKRKTEGKNIGSRRIFPAHFKLQVLDSYRNDSDCKGNQRATARKYGIHRRQIQKWLQVETNLRNCVGANNLNNKIPKKPSSSGSKFDLLERNRQRDDAFPDAYSQSQVQARVPSISPDAYSENVPLDYTTSHDLNLTPMDLSVKKPNFTLNPDLIPPPIDQNIWDLSMTKRDTNINKRKFEENPTTIITPKPVKLFKPYLDDLHDDETQPLKPQNQEKSFRTHEINNYQTLDLQSRNLNYAKVDVHTHNYQTFDAPKKTIDIQSHNLNYPEAQNYQNLEMCEAAKSYQNVDLRDTKSPLGNYHLSQIKSEQRLSLDLSPGSLEKNSCYQNLDVCDSQKKTPSYQNLELCDANKKTYQNLDIKKSPSYQNLDLCESKNRVCFPGHIKSEPNLSLDLSPRSYLQDSNERSSAEIKMEGDYYESSSKNYLEDLRKSPKSYYNNSCSSPKNFHDDSYKSPNYHDGTTKNYHQDSLHNSPKIYHDDLKHSPKSYHDDVHKSPYYDDLHKSPIPLDFHNKSPIPLDFHNKSPKNYHHDDLQKSPIPLDFQSKSPKNYHHDDQHKSPLHNKSPKSYHHEDSCKSDDLHNSPSQIDYLNKSPKLYPHEEMRTSPKMFFDDLHGKPDAKSYYNNNNEYVYPYAELTATGGSYFYNPLTVDFHRPVSDDFYGKRGYSVDFKLSPVDAYYREESQKVATSKYELHRREVQKWIKQEDEIRQRNSVVG